MQRGRAAHRRGKIGLVVLAGLLASLAPGITRPSSAFSPESLSVPANSPVGVETAQALEPGVLYRAVAWGTFGFGSGLLGDPECTAATNPELDPWAELDPVAPDWVRHRYTFYAKFDPTHPAFVLDAERDPDPTDDAVDLYIDNRNQEWIPLGVSAGSAPNPLGCNDDDHVYETYFMPRRAGPVNFRVFDIAYTDNENTTLDVFVSEVGGAELPLGRHVETVLVYAGDDPAQGGDQPVIAESAAPLESGKVYVLVAHGMWKWSGLYDIADAECTRTATDPTYEVDRFEQDGADRRELWMRTSPTAGFEDVDWEPVFPAQVWARTRPRNSNGVPTDPVTVASQGCDGDSHYYSTLVTGTGARLGFVVDDFPVVSEAPYAANSGHLSVEIFEAAG